MSAASMGYCRLGKVLLSLVWPEGGIYPVLRDFWPKRGSIFLRWGFVGLILRGDFREFPKKQEKCLVLTKKWVIFYKKPENFPIKNFSQKEICSL